MRILFDFFAVQEAQMRGIGRVGLELFKQIHNLTDWKFTILMTRRSFDLSLLPISNRWEVVYYDQWSAAKQGYYDFLFVPHVWMDLTGFSCRPDVVGTCAKAVGICHDIVYAIFPRNFLQLQSDDYSLHRWQLEAAIAVENIRLFNHLFTVSAYTKKDLVKFGRISPEDITVFYPGVESFIGENSGRDYERERRNDQLVSCLGWHRRKNFSGLAFAFATAYERGLLPTTAELLLLGNFEDKLALVTAQLKDKLKSFQRVKLGKQIKISNKVPHQDLVNLLTRARASVFPSFYEGFGLPVVESYAAGTPVIGSNLTSLREIILPECTFNPFQLEDFVAKLVKVYEDQEFCRRSLAFGRQFIALNTWQKAAEIIIDKMIYLAAIPKPDRWAVFSGVSTSLTYPEEGQKSFLCDIFKPFLRIADLDKANSNSKVFPKNIFSFLSYSWSKLYSRHRARIYLLDDEYDVVRQAIDDYRKNDPVPGWFYLKSDKWCILLRHWCEEVNLYPDKLPEIFYDGTGKPGMGLYLLWVLTGISRFLVADESLRHRILQELWWCRQLVIRVLPSQTQKPRERVLSQVLWLKISQMTTLVEAIGFLENMNFPLLVLLDVASTTKCIGKFIRVPPVNFSALVKFLDLDMLPNRYCSPAVGTHLRLSWFLLNNEYYLMITELSGKNDAENMIDDTCSSQELASILKYNLTLLKKDRFFNYSSSGEELTTDLISAIVNPEPNPFHWPPK
jgi:glycosyltransferase involved in cell wall biosynthesis